MNAIIRTLVAAFALATGVFAAPPAATRIVVLDNENVLEGHVTRVDDGYEIRLLAGGDVVVPARRVLAVVADRRAAFAVVAERANRRDADERLRLARWCANNDLPAEALVEAQSAARMRPGFAAAEQFIRVLQAAPARSTDAKIIPAAATSPVADTVTDVATLDYNSESFPMFASRVNAVLLNACATCHARDDMKSFRLTRVGGRGGATKNLMAALPYVNPKDPAASLILTKAVTPHGSAAEAPFKTRMHPALQTLESWAHIARAPEGTREPDAPPPSVTEPRTLPDLTDDKSATVIPTTTLSRPSSGEAFGQDSKSMPPTSTKPRPDDPFDPAIFNRDGKPKM